MKIFTKSQGFTLTEVLVAIFLGTLLVMTAYSVYLMSYKTYKKSNSNAELAQNARIALERMTRDIRQAREIVTVLPATGDGTTPTALKFQDGHATTQVRYVTYSLSANELHRLTSHYYCSNDSSVWVLWSTNCAPASLLEQVDLDEIKAQSISELKFYGVGAITINLAVADTEATYHFETKSYPRNIQ